MINSQDRSLARVVTLDKVVKHPNADALDLALIGGWQCVVQRDVYRAGAKAIYIEVDALVPLDLPVFAFLEGKNVVEQGGKKYSRIKTMKLRKELSQGLVIPLSSVEGADGMEDETDVTDALGILKYVKQSEQDAINGGVKNKSGTSAKGFPKFIPKTDQQRVQNIDLAYHAAAKAGELFEITYKLDGSSMTVWHKDGEVGVASRNVGFRAEDEKISFWSAVKTLLRTGKWSRVNKRDDNHFVDMAVGLDLPRRLRELGLNIALQGELVAPNIQGNFEGVVEPEYYVYDIYDIKAQRYLLPHQRKWTLYELNNTSGPEVEHVPEYEEGIPLPMDMQVLIEAADGPSGLYGKYREGLVCKSRARDFSFKVISNRYLLKEE